MAMQPLPSTASDLLAQATTFRGPIQAWRAQYQNPLYIIPALGNDRHLEWLFNMLTCIRAHNRISLQVLHEP